MHTSNVHSFPRQIGKHLISPLARLDDAGLHCASVSIRSGQGSASHDRVLRFVPRFDSRESALRYAAEQGLLWLQQHRTGLIPSPRAALS